MLRGIAVALFVVSGAARAERDDGRLVAVEDGPLMTIVYRIRASGIEKIGRQKVAGVGEFGWTDSATLGAICTGFTRMGLTQRAARNQRIGSGLPAWPAGFETSIWKRAAISASARSMFAMSCSSSSGLGAGLTRPRGDG